jgi:hypothetical protein
MARTAPYRIEAWKLDDPDPRVYYCFRLKDVIDVLWNIALMTDVEDIIVHGVDD